MTSGSVVPMETTVAPISSSGRWKRQRRCAVDEPVAALNQEQQTDDKK
jgi:hypothetical protein